MREEINNIFIVWDTQGVNVARKMLLKLYMEKYDKLNNIEDKRLILYNLICAESDMGLNEMVKNHSEVLIKDMNDEPNYKEDYEENFVRALTYYRDSHLETLSKEKILYINKYCKDVYDKYTDVNDIHYLCKLVSNFNFYLDIKDVKELLKIIKLTNENKNNSMIDYNRALNGFMKDIKNNIGLEAYKEAIKILR